MIPTLTLLPPFALTPLQDFSFRGNCLIREFDDLPRWVSRPAHRSFGGNKTRMHWYINYELDRNTVFCNPR